MNPDAPVNSQRGFFTSSFIVKPEQNGTAGDIVSADYVLRKNRSDISKLGDLSALSRNGGRGVYNPYKLPKLSSLLNQKAPLV